VTVAREGLLFIGIGTAAAIGAVALAANRESVVFWIAAAVLVALAIWLVAFFRDPERTGERGERLVVSPADGKVVQIAEVDEPTFVRGRAIRISIFMNVFNVHVNRYPVSGTVRRVQRKAGRFLNAAGERASVENEQVSVGIEVDGMRVLVRQIAGLIARRIHTYSVEGQSVSQGDRMGIIRFGSRVDVFLPDSGRPRLKVGENTIAGTTVLAELPSQ
jgi:phosphatidylserine decarboxylase